MKTVIAVDGSPTSHRAFEWAFANLSHIRDPDSQVFIVAVVEPVDLAFAHHKPYYEKMEAELAHQQEERVQILLRQYDEALNLERVAHQVVCLKGTRASQAIVEFVAAQSADSLIIGRRGLSDQERVIMGSTSDFWCDMLTATSSL
eukprot:TRINITY_DN3253_c0_g1_i1.p1 TRINITY_DN3253_c0_g1~~TRINITY_DN3253_c0_g1_i1.p1  ORF type:complete len:146 (+),score=21.31 TRINITY_DN3253_c0_g1_i1:56-493(+)